MSITERGPEATASNELAVRSSPELGWDLRAQHLAMVQAVIDRMDRNAFVVKGWSATLTGAIVALSLQTPQTHLLAWAAIAPPLICWWLDAFYLRAERRFRDLFNAIRDPSRAVPTFSMDPSSYVTSASSWWCCLRRPVVMAVHLPVLLAAAAAATFVALEIP